MTVAEAIAERFGNDGGRWQDTGGAWINEVCLESCTEHRRCDEIGGDRFVFADGSSIVTLECGWDLGYSKDEVGADAACFCWPEVGHDEACPYYSD